MNELVENLTCPNAPKVKSWKSNQKSVTDEKNFGKLGKVTRSS